MCSGVLTLCCYVFVSWQWWCLRVQTMYLYLSNWNMYVFILVDFASVFVVEKTFYANCPTVTMTPWLLEWSEKWYFLIISSIIRPSHLTRIALLSSLAYIRLYQGICVGSFQGQFLKFRNSLILKQYIQYMSMWRNKINLCIDW